MSTAVHSRADFEPSPYEQITKTDSGQMNPNSRQKWVAKIAMLLLFGMVALFVADRLFNPENFRITEVIVHGQLNHANPEHIKHAVQGAIEGNYFSANLHELEQIIESLPWVFSASIRRQWPDMLRVDVTEIQPVARWGDNHWLNFTGDIVSRQTEDEAENSQDLPLLNGSDTDLDQIWFAFRQWSELFAANGLSLEELNRSSSGLWNLKLSLGALAMNNGEGLTATVENQSILMVVEDEQVHARIARFMNVFNNHLVNDFSKIKSLDLRYPNGFAVSWRNSEGPPQSSEQITAVSTSDIGSDIGIE